MDGEGDVREGRTHLDRQGEFADQVARIRTDNRRAEEDLRVGVGDEFHEAVVLAGRQRPADRRERDLPDPRSPGLRGRLRFLQADRGDLGVREDCGGHRVDVQLDRMTRDHFGRRDAFLRRLVREERRANHIPDCEDVRVRRAQLAIHLDVSTRTELHAGDFRMEIVRVRSAAHGDEDRVRPSRDQSFRGHDVHDVRALVLAPATRLGLHVDLHAELLQVPRDDANRLRVGPREELLHDLGDDNATAELRVEHPELEAGNPAADDREVLGDAGEFEGLLRADDPLAVEPKRGQVRRPAPGRDDRVREGHPIGSFGLADLEVVRSHERGVAREDVDPVAFAQLADAVHEALDDGRLPLLYPGQVDLHGARLNATLARPLDRADQVSGMDERLARDASVVQAFAAESVSLDEEDMLPELRRADRGRIAARPCPDDHDVRVPVHHPTEQLRSLNLFADITRPSWSRRTERKGLSHVTSLSEDVEGRSAAIASKFDKSEILFYMFEAIVAASLLATTSFSLRPLSHPLCFEGGEYGGYPVAFYIRCYGPLIPGDGQSKDEPQFQAGLLAVDVIFWYFVSFAAMALVRLGVRKLWSRPRLGI